jgi:TetR/AcrR family transcriptional repressor of nem operon
MSAGSTRDALLEAAERLVRSRGYSAFSYADLADAVGIRKASIHHHFPAKADLGAALVEDYTARFRDLLADIREGEPTALRRLDRYGRIYEASVRGGMLCLCGMLATEAQVLPAELRSRIATFFAQQLDWLEAVIAEGQAAGRIASRGSARRTAEHALSALQGASMVAWGTGRPEVVGHALEDLLAGLRT